MSSPSNPEFKNKITSQEIIKMESRLDPLIPIEPGKIPLSSSEFSLRGRISEDVLSETPSHILEILTSPELYNGFIASILRDANLRIHAAKLKAANAEARADNLTDQLIQAQIERDQAIVKANQAEAIAMSLTLENQLLRENNTALEAEVKQLSPSVASAKTEPHDPDGYYRTLGLQPGALDVMTDEIAKTFLSRLRGSWSLMHHPDKGGDPRTMQEINAAVDALSNPRFRRLYGR